MCNCFTGDHKNISGKKPENNGGLITLANNWPCHVIHFDRIYL